MDKARDRENYFNGGDVTYFSTGNVSVITSLSTNLVMWWGGLDALIT
jgi:hypothetical protein